MMKAQTNLEEKKKKVKFFIFITILLSVLEVSLSNVKILA